MPPRVKFQKEEIVRAALNVARERGIDAVLPDAFGPADLERADRP